MTNPADNATMQMRGTFGFERKLGLPNYGSAVASAFIQFDIDPSSPEATEANIRAAAALAKIQVLEELGIEALIDSQGLVCERALEDRGVAIVNGVFPNATVEPKQSQQSPQPQVAAAAAPVRERAAAASDPNNPVCPECGAGMYDNRATKKNPKQPDFRCKNYKSGCQGVVWPPKGSN
jgi:hypothetical protein